MDDSHATSLTLFVFYCQTLHTHIPSPSPLCDAIHFVPLLLYSRFCTLLKPQKKYQFLCTLAVLSVLTRIVDTC
jgi:hypothetical protein